MSGGLLSKFGGHSSAKEYRVWVHGGGDDKYFTSKSFKGILKRWEKLKHTEPSVEPPLAVVWDKSKGMYREVVIDNLRGASDLYDVRYEEAKRRGLGPHPSIEYASSGPVDLELYRLAGREVKDG